MSPTLEQLKLQELSISERLELIGLLWDSITDSKPHPPIPEWHQREVDRRRLAADADPASGVPWEDVRARLLGNS
jgi:putative addiction module component (TIGR02574 family)